jgi:hypothetical protein
MSTENAAGLQSRHTTGESITINARDVLAGRYDDIRLEAGR